MTSDEIMREEKYLKAIIEDRTNVPEPITRFDRFLAKIAGKNIKVPRPITRLEMFLNKIIDETAYAPEPVTRRELYFAKIAGAEVETPKPVTREEHLLDQLVSKILKTIAKVLKIKGNTVVWNQQVDTSTSSVTLTSGHKFVTKVNGTYSVVSGTGQSLAVTGGTDEVFDLTKMLGPTLADSIYSMEQSQAGSGVAYFRKLFPLDYYSYESGKLLNFNGTSITTENADQTESSIKQLPISNYFPTGMKSAGSVYDELTPNKAIKRVGSVDLGTLTWDYNDTLKRFRATMPSDYKVPTNATERVNMVCSKYETNSSPLISDMTDSGISGYQNTNLVYAKDYTFTDASAFTSAVSGVILNYVISDVETAITENLNYKVYSGGTETLLPIDDISTSPFSANIDYPSGNEDVYFTVRESGNFDV